MRNVQICSAAHFKPVFQSKVLFTSIYHVFIMKSLQTDVMNREMQCSLFFVCSVNGQYVKQGKLGAAVLGNHSTKEVRMITFLFF